MKRFARRPGILFLIAVLLLCGAFSGNVQVQAQKLRLNKSSIVLQKGKTFTLKTVPKVKGAKYKTSNKKVATVTKKGKIKAKKPGKATITCYWKKKRVACRVTVKNKKKKDSEQTNASTASKEQPTEQTTAATTEQATTQAAPCLSSTQLELAYGTTQPLQLNNAPAKVAWKSSDTSIAYCSNGTLEARSVGTATITALCNGKPYNCAVTVVSGEDTVLKEDGKYTSKEMLAQYIAAYHKLPEHFMTKTQAQALGWQGGSLLEYAKFGCIGGDVYSNYEKKLETADGRIYYECDVDTLGALSRGAKRLVYSNDGLIYYTGDHYNTFERIDK